ncbi:MAG: hypothetical protein ABR510_06715 [Trueperaceae bacterium]
MRARYQRRWGTPPPPESAAHHERIERPTDVHIVADVIDAIR